MGSGTRYRDVGRVLATARGLALGAVLVGFGSGGPALAGPGAALEIAAADFVRACDVAPAAGSAGQYGQGVILNAPPYSDRPNCAEYDFAAPAAGVYRLEIEYAAAEPRPVRVSVNGRLITEAALADATGCWTPNCQQWTGVADIALAAGRNTLLLERAACSRISGRCG